MYIDRGNQSWRTAKHKEIQRNLGAWVNSDYSPFTLPTEFRQIHTFFVSCALGILSSVAACSSSGSGNTPDADVAAIDAAIAVDAEPDVVPSVVYLNENFEAGLERHWGYLTTTGSMLGLSSNQKHSGAQSIQMVTGNAYEQKAYLSGLLPFPSYSTAELGSDLYVSVWFYLGQGFPITNGEDIEILALQTGERRIAQLSLSSSQLVLTGRKTLMNRSYQADFEFPVRQWVRLELQLNTSVADGHVKLRVDDAKVLDTTVDILEDLTLDLVHFGIYRQDYLESYEMFVDDILVGDEAL